MAELVNTPTFQRRNNFRVILITVLIIGLLTLIVLAIIWRPQPVHPVRAGISKNHASVGEEIAFTDTSSDFAKEWYWTFGDNDFSTLPNCKHTYARPDMYTVKLKINNDDRYTKTFTISVKDTTHQAPPVDSIPKIVAPKTAEPDYYVLFKAIGTGGEACEWVFGDQDATIYKGPTEMNHAYKEEGVYYVLVRGANNRYAKHQINIKKPVDSVVYKKRLEKMGNDFREHLQQIANNADYNIHYEYLMEKYLCFNGKATMKINKDKSTTFYHYCRELSIDDNVLVQSAIIKYDKGCVTSVEITQDKMRQ